VDKVPYTKWDHFKWSFVKDDEVRFPRHVTSDQASYRAWYAGGISRPVGSFRNECISAAYLVYEEAARINKRIRVMMSGGADSEIVAWSFKLAGIDFVPTFMEFHDRLNQHELLKARESASDLGIPLDIISVDIHKIVKWSEDETYSKFHAPISYAHRWLAKQFPDNLAVWGCGDLVLRRDREGNSYVEFGAGRHHSYDIYAYDTPYYGVEQFLHYTPELAYASYSHPMVQAWVNSPRAMPHPFYSTKFAMYKMEFPEIHTDREKRTGAEYIRAIEADFVNKHAHLAPFCFRPLVKYQDVLAQVSKTP